jgi:hypothetical protein
MLRRLVYATARHGAVVLLIAVYAALLWIVTARHTERAAPVGAR